MEPVDIPSPDSMAPIARLIDQMRSPDFLDGLGEMLGSYAPGISFALVHFASRGRPTVLTHNLTPLQNRCVLVPYVERMYLLDPMHQQWRDHEVEGVWRLHDIAPQGFRDSEYFATYYHNLGLTDETAATFSLGDGEALSLSFGCYSSVSGVSADRLVEHIRYLFPVLAALTRQFWMASSLYVARHDETPSLLESFGKECLSERERETAMLILRGNTTPEIASLMGIAPGTVKNHRKRIYAKLNISSQAELFRQFMLFQRQEPPAGEG